MDSLQVAEREFASLLAPLLLGAVLSCPVFAITVAQTVSYFRAYPTDVLALKLFVLFLLLIDGFQTFAIVSAAKAAYLVAQVSLKYPAGIYIHLYLTTLVVIAVQGFYVRRLWIVSHGNRWVSGALSTLLVVELISGAGLDIVQQVNGDAKSLHSPTSNAFSACALASRLVSDLLIASSLIYYLNKWRSGIRRTENILDRLIIYVVGIGFLTSLFAALVFITWLASPDTFLFLAFFSVLSKLYLNSILVTLNARKSFRDVTSIGCVTGRGSTLEI